MASSPRRATGAGPRRTQPGTCVVFGETLVEKGKEAKVNAEAVRINAKTVGFLAETALDELAMMEDLGEE